MPAQAQKTLFLPLRQVPTAESERKVGSSGLGLGLYISREIALAHGGSITAASQADGSTFTVRLPRVPPVARDRRSKAAHTCA